MATIYDIDFAKAGERLLPPDKRQSKMKSFITALLSPAQWVRDLWLSEYKTGSTANEWLNTTTYAKYARVIYNIYVYESLIDVNNALPSDPTAWRVVQTNFIGLSERLLYNTKKLTLEYALNKRFKTHFRQPPNVSDIYILANMKTLSVFLVGGSEDISSKVYSNTSTEFVIDAYNFGAYVNMTIYIPVAVYNALDAIAINRDKIVRSFVDQYLAAGIIYTITTY